MCQHLRESHIIGKALKCIECELNFENDFDFKTHNDIYHSNLLSDSQEVNNLVTNETSVEEIIRNDSVLTQKNSDKSSENKEILAQKAFQFSCNFTDCSRSFETKQELIKHMIESHTEKRLISKESIAEKMAKKKSNSGHI